MGSNGLLADIGSQAAGYVQDQPVAASGHLPGRSHELPPAPLPRLASCDDKSAEHRSVARA